MFGLNFFEIIFIFFFMSFSGWVGECIMESVVRKRFVSKGFFKGPYVPVHGIGAFVIYAACMPLKPYPYLVFIAGTVITTVIEYIAALVLEKVFGTKGWDYTTYPFTKKCHYKGRIAVSTSVFFGVVATGLIYFYWDAGILLMNFTKENPLAVIGTVLCVILLIDAVYSGTVSIRNKKAGIPNKTAGIEYLADLKTAKEDSAAS
ncbi:MAG: putative ABC transporter permease [Treponema sp.]|nr:putative ABC transporter permease [Treponema sp.]